MVDYYKMLELNRNDSFIDLHETLQMKLEVWRRRHKKCGKDQKNVVRKKIRLIFAAQAEWATPYYLDHYNYLWDIENRKHLTEALYEEGYPDRLFMDYFTGYLNEDDFFIADRILADEMEWKRLKANTLAVAQMMYYRYRLGVMLNDVRYEEGVDIDLWLKEINKVYDGVNEYRKAHKDLLTDYDSSWMGDLKKDIKKVPN